MPKATVIVPNYNHARFLRQRIDTILAQTFQDFELILLDDCSTDDSRSILSSYASDPRVRLDFNDKNSGSTFKQWNKGVRLARCEYVWIAESDDYADPSFLERLVAILESDESVAFAYCRSWCSDLEGHLDGFADSYYLGHIDPRRWAADFCAEGREECRNYLVRANTVLNASSAIFRRTAYEAAGGADTAFRLCGDWKLWVAMALLGKVAYCAEPLNFFRFHNVSVRSKAIEERRSFTEALEVIGWILTRVTPPEAVLKKVRQDAADAWVPALLSAHVAAEVKRKLLREIRSVDSHPVRSAFRPAFNAVRLKFLRHWHSLRPAKGMASQ